MGHLFYKCDFYLTDFSFESDFFFEADFSFEWDISFINVTSIF